MINENMAKAERLWQSIHEAAGEVKPFPAKQVQTALSLLTEQIATDDPIRIVY
jgi:hypothetical protein